MKYIVNCLLFLIMIYSLTVMPIDMKALQVDVSWEKYKAIEAEKENQEQQKEITETVKTSQYTLSIEGDDYRFNPDNISVKLMGDEKLIDLKSDVLSKLTLAFKNNLTGEEQIYTVPSNAITESSVASGQNTMQFAIALNSLTQIPDGQYTLSLASKSELTQGENPTLRLSWFKTASYTDPRGVNLGNTFVTYYYPTTDLQQLIPVTERVSSDKILRKMATHLLNGTAVDSGLKTGQIAPRIRNIQLKSGKLSLYFTQADVDAALKTGLSAKQMTDILTKSYFSLDYINEVYFFLNNKPADANLVNVATALPVTRPAVANSQILHGIEVGTKIYWLPTEVPSLTLETLASALSAEQVTLKGKKALSPIPSNVQLRFSLDPEVKDQVIADIQLTGQLYGNQPELSLMFFDYISQNVKRNGIGKTLVFKINGQTVENLNGVNLAVPYSPPKYLNVMPN